MKVSIQYNDRFYWWSIPKKRRKTKQVLRHPEIQIVCNHRDSTMNQMHLFKCSSCQKSKIKTDSDRSTRSVLVRFKEEWRAHKSFWAETGLGFGNHLCCCVNSVFQTFLYECTQNVGRGSGSKCSIVCQSHWACGYWLPLTVTGFMYLRHYQSLSIS